MTRKYALTIAHQVPIRLPKLIRKHTLTTFVDIEIH